MLGMYVPVPCWVCTSLYHVGYPPLYTQVGIPIVHPGRYLPLYTQVGISPALTSQVGISPALTSQVGILPGYTPRWVFFPVIHPGGYPR